MFWDLVGRTPPIIDTSAFREWVWRYIQGEIQAVITSGHPLGAQPDLGTDAEYPDYLLVYEPGLAEGTFGTVEVGTTSGQIDLLLYYAEVFHVVPEPSALILLFIALTFATVCWWRRQRFS